ncbi:hypothetical protein MmiAt1_07280 [Methanimicrococcus sp. At1]|uniref:Uncharacterized protein n=1 Tax=Methanimicrococcus hacksteinii TaxID=3028293 RepID=A0ABU3VP47_9EURY|nr:hypothetical protein [Methanimicrococcus sp. At1]MDV0445171.1 hypothetical protein [Methanimicrococcus sp. At1]
MKFFKKASNASVSKKHSKLPAILIPILLAVSVIAGRHILKSPAFKDMKKSLSHMI